MFRSNFKNFLGPGHHRCNQSWKPDPDNYIWHPKHTHTICGAVSIISRQYGWKIIQSSFDDFGPRYHRGEKGWKLGPKDSILHQKHTHIIRYAVLIVLRSVRLKNVSVEFLRPFGHEGHRSSQSWKSSLDDSVLTAEVYPSYLGHISCRFLCVWVETVSDKFLRLFRARARPEHEKLKPGPRWLGLAPETYTHFLGAILIVSHQYGK